MVEPQIHGNIFFFDSALFFLIAAKVVSVSPTFSKENSWQYKAQILHDVVKRPEALESVSHPHS